jgi:hypothetical protein
MKKIFFIALIGFACILSSCTRKESAPVTIPECKLKNNVALNKFLDEAHITLVAEVDMQEEIISVRPLTEIELALKERRQGKLELLHQLDKLRESN